MSALKGKTVFITGGSRGIGRAIALRVAQEGANVAILAKTAEPHATLEGTIFTVAEEIEQKGGKALPLQGDIRFQEQIEEAVQKTAHAFGGIDILINNASAINLTGTMETSLKKFDLMMGVNVRGTFATSQACLPYLLKSANPHILMLSPPLNMVSKWFKKHAAYTISKYGMSMVVLGMAEEFRAQGVAVNALWPKTTIATAAVKMLGGEPLLKASRYPAIVADAAYYILTKDSQSCTGNFFVDEEVLREEGVKDFSGYAVTPQGPLIPDFFLD